MFVPLFSKLKRMRKVDEQSGCQGNKSIVWPKEGRRSGVTRILENKVTVILTAY